MERIIRIGVTFLIMLAVGFLSIFIAEGDLSASSIGLVGLVVLTAGLGAGVWAIVHGRFETKVEIALTVGILFAMIIGAMVLLYVGSEIKTILVEMFTERSAWWLVAPVLGTTALTFLLGLHETRRRTAAEAA